MFTYYSAEVVQDVRHGRSPAFSGLDPTNSVFWPLDLGSPV